MQPTDRDLYEQIKERVKASVQRWPSAYASGMLVKLYKKEMDARGKLPFVNLPTVNQQPPPPPPLSRWFAEKWVDINTGRPCGAVRTIKYYPVCRPSVRVNDQTPITVAELPPGSKAKVTRAKQAAGTKTIQWPTNK